MREQFLAERNIDVLFRITSDHIRNNTGENVENYTKLNIKRRMSGVMEKILTQTDLDSLQGSLEQRIAHLNKRVILVCVEGFQNLITKAKHSPGFRMNRVDHRPEMTSQPDGNTDVGESSRQSVNQQYERLTNERNGPRDTGPTLPPNFTEDLNKETHEDPSIMFKLLEEERKLEMAGTVQPTADGSNPMHPSDFKEAPVVEKASGPSASKVGNEQSDFIKQAPTSSVEQVDGMIRFEEQQDEFRSREQQFKERLDRLQSKREAAFRKASEHSPVEKEVPRNVMVPEGPGGMGNTLTPLNPRNVPNLTPGLQESIMQQRNQLDYEVHTGKSIVDRDPRQLLQPPPSVSVPPPDLSMSSRMGMPFVREQASVLEDTIIHYTLVINAFDRKWYGEWSKNDLGEDVLSEGTDLNRYSFSVKCGGDENMASIKRNFHNVTSIELTDVIMSAHDNPTYVGGYRSSSVDAIGLPGSRDTIDPFDTSNMETDSEEEIDVDVKDDDENSTIDTETITIKTDVHTTEEGDPEEATYTAATSLNVSLQNYPYLLFNIEEFSGNIVTTNETNNRATSRLVIAKHFLNSKTPGVKPNLAGFLLLRPILIPNTGMLEFRPTPLASLNTLTFSIATPDGRPYVSENPWNLDGQRIRAVTLRNTPFGREVDIHVQPVFHSFLYDVGDVLLLKSFQFLRQQGNIQTTMGTLQGKVFRHLTNEYGVHVISKRYSSGAIYGDSHIPAPCHSVAKGFCNVLTVAMPEEFDPRTGVILDGEVPLKTEWLAGGCLLNKSIQPVFTLRVSCSEREITKDNLVISTPFN